MLNINYCIGSLWSHRELIVHYQHIDSEHKIHFKMEKKNASFQNQMIFSCLILMNLLTHQEQNKHCIIS